MQKEVQQSSARQYAPIGVVGLQIPKAVEKVEKNEDRQTDPKGGKGSKIAPEDINQLASDAGRQ